jgi:hypothetical protein
VSSWCGAEPSDPSKRIKAALTIRAINAAILDSAATSTTNNQIDTLNVPILFTVLVQTMLAGVLSDLAAKHQRGDAAPYPIDRSLWLSSLRTPAMVAIDMPLKISPLSRG